MVDRITPAPTSRTLSEAVRLIGCEDHAAVETEPFTQWVIEDRFPAGRPTWEAGGAIFVADVAPYERMKLRMLNGAHSMLAYAGFLSGRAYVRDVMADPALAALVERHLKAAAATLPPLDGLDLAEYAVQLA
jgi:fructuronate reductase